MQRPAGDRRQLARQKAHLDGPRQLHLLFEPPALGRLFDQGDVADAQRGDRGERGQELEVVGGEAAHMGARVERDHAERALVVVERGRDQAADAGHHQAGGMPEALVGGDVADQRRLALLDHLLVQGAREKRFGARARGAPRGGPPVAAGGVAQHDDALLRAEGLPGAVEDQLEELGQGHRAPERAVDLVQHLQAFRVAPQRFGVELAGAPAGEEVRGLHEHRGAGGGWRRRDRHGARRAALGDALDHQQARADADLIAGRERFARGQGVRVAPRSGARAQVLDPPGTGLAHQSRVAARSGAVGQHDVALFGAADEDRVLIERARGGAHGIANGEDDLGHRLRSYSGFGPRAPESSRRPRTSR